MALINFRYAPAVTRETTSVEAAKARRSESTEFSNALRWLSKGAGEMKSCIHDGAGSGSGGAPVGVASAFDSCFTWSLIQLPPNETLGMDASEGRTRPSSEGTSWGPRSKSDRKRAAAERSLSSLTLSRVPKITD